MSTTFEIQRRDLAQLLSTAMAFAHKDRTIPAINCIRLSIEKGYLVAASTDRFRLGLARVLIDDQDIVGKSFPIGLLSLIDARKVISHVKTPVREQSLPAIVTFDTDATPSTLTVDNYAAAFTVRLISADFPKVEEIVQTALAATPEAATVQVNGEYLATYKVAEWTRGDSLTVRTSSSNRPILILCGDHFIGIQMPIRMPESRGVVLESWATFFAPEPAPEPEKPKRAPRKKAPTKAVAKAPVKKAAPKKAPAKRTVRAAK